MQPKAGDEVFLALPNNRDPAKMGMLRQQVRAMDEWSCSLPEQSVLPSLWTPTDLNLCFSIFDRQKNVQNRLDSVLKKDWIKVEFWTFNENRQFEFQL